MVGPGTAGKSQEDLRAQFLSHMPTVDLFEVKSAPGRSNADYPFTTALYESSPYGHYSKQHFYYLMLPRSMEDSSCARDGTVRSFLLRDARFISP